GFLTKMDTDFVQAANTEHFGGVGLIVEPYQMLMDRGGYLLMVGLVEGEGTLNTKSVTQNQSTFLVAYDVNLTPQRTVVYTELNEYVGAVDAATDEENNIYVAGYTLSALDDNTFSGMKDAFVIKFDSFYDKTWVSQVGQSTGHTDGLAISVDASGNSYVVGDTSAVLSGSAATGTKDYFVAKFNALGVLQ
ncbi:MAG: SBBP repeat-containing protein, partial [Reinekea sp.]|nr:SBBP repeat-containing protein [Reinekea sp.]